MIAALVAALLMAGGRTIVVAPGGPLDLAAAVAAARDGDRIEVHGGSHDGALVVERAVALVGIGWPVIDGHGAGTVLTLASPGSRVSGFVIRGTGDRNDLEDSGVLAMGSAVVEDNRLEDVLYGINLKRAPDSVVARNTIVGRDVTMARRGDGIRLWESHRSRVVDNVVRGGRDTVLWYSENIEVRGNDIADGRYGLHLMYTSGSTIAGNQLERNTVGVYAMYSAGVTVEQNVVAGSHGSSGYGLAFKDCDAATVVGNVLAGNRVGLYLDNTPSARGVRDRVAENTFAWNDIGVLLLPAVKGNDFGGNAFVENGQQVALAATGTLSGNDWTPGGAGNYWSTYAGYDADGDGLGDLPHEEASLFDDLMTKRPELRLFAMGPAQGAIDMAARAFPVFRPAPVLVDAAPRIAPLPPTVAARASDVRPLVVLAAALLGSAGLVVAWSLGMDLDLDLGLGLGRSRRDRAPLRPGAA